MLVFKTILGNIETLADIEKYEVENIFLNQEDVQKKVILATSDMNHEYGIKLPEGNMLQDGDILFNEDGKLIIVRLELSDVLVITARNIGEMAMIAHNLGNRHTPALFDENSISVPYDYLVEEFLKESKALYERKKIKLKEPFRYCADAK
ncbi:urease accessory protein UreE [Ureaplasma canigenitalium]|uniref:urease accessory protein UreE n=1 Tax=Ureaplasma canigenitalium TaxID=42092 RepID=UPI0004E25FBA|nr:urease accessory protein UreE [Ureaplasma canigenitalium]